MVPEYLWYTTTDEWCRIEGDIVTLGITEYALTGLGDIIYVELPDAGDDVLVEIVYGEIEGMESAKELISMFDGIVQETNMRVVSHPDILAKDPYGGGWLIRLKKEGISHTGERLSAAEYERFVRKGRR